eukprot:TRINITY_DN65879_c0_g1_i2.p1 TRINITY_DN65879_c0_g1~~TRINITY_DN65879_c0_g1_i2.p1  ORF type:complete len:291 (-),score=44.35 TRINITY_DN65879_c0_g1_i2:144-1016(-)
MLKAQRERGETAMQLFCATKEAGGVGGIYRRQTTYDGRDYGAKAGNSNYKKAFDPNEGLGDHNKILPPKGRLNRMNTSEQKGMSNLANLGRKAMAPIGEAYRAGASKPISQYMELEEKVEVSKPKFGTGRPNVKLPLDNEEEYSFPSKASKRRFEEKQDIRYAGHPISEKKPKMPEEEEKPIKAGMGVPEVSAGGPTEECQYCGRKFNPETLVKHERVCQERPDKKKRKVFDSSKARLVSKEQAQLKTKSTNIETKKITNKFGKKIPKWKVQSEQFRAAMNVKKLSLIHI